jgi:hypothetical protein
MSILRRTFSYSLAAALFLFSAHRLPAPIQEAVESPTPSSPTPSATPVVLSPVTSSARSELAWPGEAFPETRVRRLKPEELATWNTEEVRYAINEMYARGGYDFRTPEIKQVFMHFTWYRERLVNGRTQDEADAHLSALERMNLELLQGVRREKQ